MRTFAEITAIAAERKGGADRLLEGLAPPLTADALAAIPDDRWLAAMARGIFQAGISWKVVDAKWPGIEDAFHRFDPGRVQMMSEDEIEALLSDTRVIRSGPKIISIRENAAFLCRNPGFGRRVGDWPAGDHAGLLAWLGAEGSRLGGTTGQYLLRHMGKDSFILTQDVVARLVAEGVIAGPPGSKKAMAAVQAAFNAWAAESGQSLSAISRILAQSI